MSGGRKKWSGGGGTSVAKAIPPEAMKMVERVRAVVDRSDHEIHAALVACKMDPDNAANFLMSLDTFDEVEGKCKNKTETKGAQESRSEIVSGSSTCGSTGDIHDGGPSISMQMSSSDFGVMHGKLVQEKDNGMSTIATSSMLSSGMAASNSSQRLIPQSDSDSINTSHSTGPIDSLSFSSRSLLSFQPTWSGAPAHPKMADTVRMSGCQGKDSSTPVVATAPADSINTSHSTGPVDDFSFFSHPPFSFQQNLSRAPGHPTMPDIVGMGGCQQKASSITIAATAGCQSKSCDAVRLHESHINSMLNQNTFLPVELNGESPTSRDHVSNVTEINRDPGGSGIQQTSHEELSLANQPSVSSDQIVSQIFDASANHADELSPSSLHADWVDLSFLDDHQAVDGITRGQNLPTKSIKSASASDRQVDNSGYGFLHVQGHHEAEDAGMDLSLATSQHHHEERIGPFLDDNISFITGTSTDNYGMLSTPQTEVIRNDTFVSQHAIQQNFPSASGYAFSNTTQPTAAAYTYRQGNSHVQNLFAFSSAMQSSRPAVYPTSQRPPWIMPNTSIYSGPILNQHPTLPSYSLPTHPPGHHLPSAAIQPAYSASIAFQQSPAMLHRAGTGYITPSWAVRGNYVNDFAPLAGGYGGSWNSANIIRGSYRGTPLGVPASRGVGYQEGARGSQFMGANRFLPPRWGEYAPTWAGGGTSTGTLTARPRSASFRSRGRNQRGGVRGRQRASRFQTLGDPRNYGSQAGPSEEQ